MIFHPKSLNTMRRGVTVKILKNGQNHNETNGCQYIVSSDCAIKSTNPTMDNPKYISGINASN